MESNDFLWFCIILIFHAYGNVQFSFQKCTHFDVIITETIGSVQKTYTFRHHAYWQAMFFFSSSSSSKIFAFWRHGCWKVSFHLNINILTSLVLRRLVFLYKCTRFDVQSMKKYCFPKEIRKHFHIQSTMRYGFPQDTLTFPRPMY